MRDAAAVLASQVKHTDQPRARRIRKRECGECRACCEMIGARAYLPEEFRDVKGPCPMLCDAGCSIYRRRPDVCRQYLCGWRAGLGEAGDRPDRVGWILDIQGEAAPYAVRFIATGPHGTMAGRDALAQRCGEWFRSLPAQDVASVVTMPWMGAA